MKKICLYFIRFYQKRISPLIHLLGFDCKYYPTCSEYMRTSNS